MAAAQESTADIAAWHSWPGQSGSLHGWRQAEKAASDLARAAAWKPIPAEPEVDHNPGGPLTEKQARKLFEDVLQAAIRQKADAILIDSLSGRPQVRLRVEGKYQELTGVGDEESFRRLVAQARSCAGLPRVLRSPGGRGSFLRLYRKGHLQNAVGVRDDGEESPWLLTSIRGATAPCASISNRFPPRAAKRSRYPCGQRCPSSDTRFDLGFAAEAEEKFIRAARSRSGIVLLTGPCNCGKVDRHLPRPGAPARRGAEDHHRGMADRVEADGDHAVWISDGKMAGCFDDRLGAVPAPGHQRRPDVLMLQNIDWIDDKAVQSALDYAAAGGLLITAVHISRLRQSLGLAFLRRYFWNRRQEGGRPVQDRGGAAAVVHGLHALRRGAAGAGQDIHPGRHERSSRRRRRQCRHLARPRLPALREHGELGSIVVYEVLDLTGEMKRFIENENDWTRHQVEYLERQAWQHGMRTQRELALERVLAGDISLQEALLNTDKPRWLVEAQAARAVRPGNIALP